MRLTEGNFPIYRQEQCSSMHIDLRTARQSQSNCRVMIHLFAAIITAIRKESLKQSHITVETMRLMEWPIYRQEQCSSKLMHIDLIYIDFYMHIDFATEPSLDVLQKDSREAPEWAIWACAQGKGRGLPKWPCHRLY
jgi:hypothetical protein